MYFCEYTHHKMNIQKLYDLIIPDLLIIVWVPQDKGVKKNHKLLLILLML